MDQSKEELLGTIQRLNGRQRQQSSDLRGQKEALKDIDDELPAKQELVELLNKARIAQDRLKTERANSEEYRNQKEAVNVAQADLNTTQESLSENLVLYMVKTKKKAVHASPNEPAEVDREIITHARIGKKVAANLSLFDEENG